METLIKNDNFEVSITGRNYDFIAVIENNSDEKLKIVFDNDEDYYLEIEPNDWLGLLADDEGYSMLNYLKNNNYEVYYE